MMNFTCRILCKYVTVISNWCIIVTEINSRYLTIAQTHLLRGIEYNPSIKGKGEYPNEIVSTNCKSEKWDTEVEKDKKVSFDNVTNAG